MSRDCLGVSFWGSRTSIRAGSMGNDEISASPVKSYYNELWYKGNQYIIAVLEYTDMGRERVVGVGCAQDEMARILEKKRKWMQMSVLSGQDLIDVVEKLERGVDIGSADVVRFSREKLPLSVKLAARKLIKNK